MQGSERLRSGRLRPGRLRPGRFGPWVVAALALALVTGGPAATAATPGGRGPAPARTGSTAAAPGVRTLGTVATGLAVPWAISLLPGGSALVAERDTGRIRRVYASGSKRLVGTVPGVVAGGEGGLLGLRVSPHFARDHWVYAYLSTARDNRVVRMTYASGRLSGLRVLLRGIPRGPRHNGGGLAFSPAGMLYVSTGDASRSELAPRRGSLGGKVLRMYPDGRLPRTNPFPRSYVWTVGHRNVQGLAFDSRGHLWATEFGQDRFDELNLVQRGRNYGWPATEGRTTDPRYVSPKAVWRTSAGGPSGMAVVADVAWIGAVTGQRLYRVPLRAASAGTPVGYLAGRYGRLRAVAASPVRGQLWVSTTNRDGRGRVRPGDDRILRLRVG